MWPECYQCGCNYAWRETFTSRGSSTSWFKQWSPSLPGGCVWGSLTRSSLCLILHQSVSCWPISFSLASCSHVAESPLQEQISGSWFLLVLLPAEGGVMIWLAGLGEGTRHAQFRAFFPPLWQHTSLLLQAFSPTGAGSTPEAVLDSIPLPSQTERLSLILGWRIRRPLHQTPKANVPIISFIGHKSFSSLPTWFCVFPSFYSKFKQEKSVRLFIGLSPNPNSPRRGTSKTLIIKSQTWTSQYIEIRHHSS